jgi:hypothetical protein
MERERAVVIGVVAVIALGFWLAVDGSPDEEGARADPPDPAAHECEHASDALVTAIGEGLAGHRFIGARIVRSDDLGHRYYVAGTVNGTLAVFVTDDPDGGTIRAVDERTTEVADWPLDEDARPDDAFVAVMSCSVER